MQVHRLVIVDDAGRVEGIVSLSDILSYIVLRPAAASLGKFYMHPVNFLFFFVLSFPFLNNN